MNKRKLSVLLLLLIGFYPITIAGLGALESGGVHTINEQNLTKVSALPQVANFKSGISTDLHLPIDFTVLYEKVSPVYEVTEHDNSHIIWNLPGGDLAFANSSGKLAILSTASLGLPTVDNLKKEIGSFMDILITSGTGIPSDVRQNVLEDATYYSNEFALYHTVKYDNTKQVAEGRTPILNLELKVPDVKIDSARFTVYDNSIGISDQGYDYWYYIGDNQILYVVNPSVGTHIWVSDIKDKLSKGLNGIWGAGKGQINLVNTIQIEFVTPPTSEKFILYTSDSGLIKNASISNPVSELVDLIFENTTTVEPNAK
jgi:hypothetical protein